MSYPLANHFEDAAQKIKDLKDKLKKSMGNEELQVIYGLYKQATIGDVNIEKPGFFSFEAKAKWEAWNQYKGMSQEEAKHKYVEFLLDYLPDEVTANYK